MAKSQQKLEAELPRVVQLDDGRLAFDPEPGVTVVYTPVNGDGVGRVSIEFLAEKSFGLETR